MATSRTLVLLAHGSRAAETLVEMRELTGRLGEAEPGLDIRGAFLSLSEPDLARAVREAVEAGAAEVDILPLFLFSGKHVLGDIPAQVEALGAEYPGVKLVLLDPIGRHPDFAGFLLKASVRP